MTSKDIIKNDNGIGALFLIEKIVAPVIDVLSVEIPEFENNVIKSTAHKNMLIPYIIFLFIYSGIVIWV